jgi:hypothetical protein
MSWWLLLPVLPALVFVTGLIRLQRIVSRNCARAEVEKIMRKLASRKDRMTPDVLAAFKLLEAGTKVASPDWSVLQKVAWDLDQKVHESGRVVRA